MTVTNTDLRRGLMAIALTGVADAPVRGALDALGLTEPTPPTFGLRPPPSMRTLTPAGEELLSALCREAVGVHRCAVTHTTVALDITCVEDVTAGVSVLGYFCPECCTVQHAITQVRSRR